MKLMNPDTKNVFPESYGPNKIIRIIGKLLLFELWNLIYAG